MPSTFISYRRDDAAGYAGRLHEALEDRLGRGRVFRDVDTLEPGRDFIDAIEHRLRECRIFLALIGREWLDSRDAAGRRRLDQPNDLVRLEIMSALARRDVLVVPVLIEGAAMPVPDEVPEDIRALTRRQAVHLRDDAWDHDVDRLTEVIQQATPTAGDPIRRATAAAAWPALMSRPIVVAGVVVALLALVWLGMGRNRDGDAQSSVNPPTEPVSASSTSEPTQRQAAGNLPANAGPPYGIAIPRVAEVAHSRLIYTLLSATVIPLGNGSSELRLRVRFSNEGPYGGNFWNASFRLATGNDMLAPSGDLNEVVAGHSLIQGIVIFTLPNRLGPAVLRVIAGERIGEIPLDLSPSSRPAEDEKADAGDALSRAIVRPVVSEPKVLVNADDFAVTVTSGTSRRFANVVRVRFRMRYAYGGPYSAYTGTAVLRMAAGDQVVAPIVEPGTVIAARSTTAGDVEFEVPSDTKRVVLRGTIGQTTRELTFEVQ